MQPAQTPPNVVYIFPDQFRIQSLGFWKDPAVRSQTRITPDPVYTPNLDRLARQSVVLTSAVSNCPLSSPHRGMLLTGMYPDGSGVPLNCNSNRPCSSLRSEAICISDVYASQGYQCAYIGKLHVDYPTPNDPDRPGQYVEERRPAWDAFTPKERRHGFDYWYSYGTFDVHKEPHYWDSNDRRHEIRQWSPRHEADQAIAYLQEARQANRKGRPFFLMVAMNPPHSPYSSLEDVEEEDYRLYANQPIEKLLIRPNADRTRKKAASAAYYFAAVTGVDREIGRILEALRVYGLEENTIVVFTSDHGETMCSQSTDDPKNSIYSESFNVPFLIRYPQYLTPRIDPLILSTPDIMPTLLALSGLEKHIPESVQGKNLSPFLLRPEEHREERPQGALYLKNIDGRRDANGQVIDYFPIARGIKTDRYTLELQLDRKSNRARVVHFFDDLNDPFQLANLPFDPQSRVGSELLRHFYRLLHEARDPWATRKIEIVPN